MKILFLARHFTYFRNFESAIRLLAERGHRIHLAADQEDSFGGRQMVDRLAAEHPGISAGLAPPRADERWFALATTFRRTLDYFRYRDARYASAPKIRERAYERTPRLGLTLARLPGRRLLTAALAGLEHAIPRDEGIDRYIASHEADVVLLTPLIELGSPQLDYLKSARAFGARTALCVWSWDHLSSKALIRLLPDCVLVWNDTQRAEATELHGVPTDRVVVTGAQCFDHWFDRRPSRSREEFCRTVDLPADRPYVLYVCSALFKGSSSEAAFVARWIERLRATDDPALGAAGLLVRPHPQRLPDWDNVDLSRFEGVALHGGNPIDVAAREDYFDSLYYSAAVVGLNTSALLEAAIVNRPVHTILLPEFSENQEGTLHFRYLLSGPERFLHVARDLGEHAAQLSAALRGEPALQNRAFVERFIRPAGLHEPATPRFADAVERLGATNLRAPVAPSLWALALRPLAASLKPLTASSWGQWLMADPVEAREGAQRIERLRRKQTVIRQSEAARSAKEQGKRRRWRAKKRQQRAVRLKTIARRMLGSERLRS